MQFVKNMCWVVVLKRTKPLLLVHNKNLHTIYKASIQPYFDYCSPLLDNCGVLLLRLPVGRGGVLKCPRFWFFFRCQKSAQRSWVIPLNIAVLSPTFKVNF